jgi:hypothetical protein
MLFIRFKQDNIEIDENMLMENTENFYFLLIEIIKYGQTKIISNILKSILQ